MERFRDGAWLVLVALAAGAVAYWPLTGSFFHADDFLHLYDIADGRLGEFYLTPHAGHLYLARNAVFILHYWLFGADPQGYYWTAYLTHLLNIGLLFAVIRRAAGSARLACFGAALWGVSPLNEGALNWYAVYGHVLLTTCLLGALLCLLRIDDGRTEPRRGGALAAALVLLAALSFGIGIGLAVAMALAVGLLIPAPEARGPRRWLRLLPLALPLLYVGMQVGYALVAGHRHETAGVVLTLRQAVLEVPLVTAALVAVGTATMAGGGAVLGLPEPWLIAAGGVMVAALALLGARADRTGRRLAAVALLIAGAYGIVAAGRVPLLGTVGAGLAAVPRYHYAPTALIALAACLALSRVRLPAAAANGLLVAALAAIGVAGWRYPPPIDGRAEQRKVATLLRANVARKVAAAAPGQTVYVHNRNFLPMNYIVERGAFPGLAALYILFFPANQVDGVAVRFVDIDQRVVAAARARHGTRTADLLVTSAEHQAALAGQPTPGSAAPP